MTRAEAIQEVLRRYGRLDLKVVKRLMLPACVARVRASPRIEGEPCGQAARYGTPERPLCGTHARIEQIPGESTG